MNKERLYVKYIQYIWYGEQNKVNLDRLSGTHPPIPTMYSLANPLHYCQLRVSRI